MTVVGEVETVREIYGDDIRLIEGKDNFEGTPGSVGIYVTRFRDGAKRLFEAGPDDLGIEYASVEARITISRSIDV